jgi:hypothetical protein
MSEQTNDKPDHVVISMKGGRTHLDAKQDVYIPAHYGRVVGIEVNGQRYTPSGLPQINATVTAHGSNSTATIGNDLPPVPEGEAGASLADLMSAVDEYIEADGSIGEDRMAGALSALRAAIQHYRKENQ